MVTDALKPRHAPWRRPLAFVIAAMIVSGLIALFIAMQVFKPSFITVERIDVLAAPGSEPIVSSFRTINRDAAGGFNVRVYERLPDGRTSGRCIFPLPGGGSYYNVPYRVDPKLPQYVGASPGIPPDIDPGALVAGIGQPAASGLNTARNYWRAYTGDADGQCFASLQPGQYFLRVEWAERVLWWWRPVHVHVSEPFWIAGAGAE